MTDYAKSMTIDCATLVTEEGRFGKRWLMVVMESVSDFTFCRIYN